MDVNIVRAKKARLQADIEILVNKFVAETGCFLNGDIKVQMKDTQIENHLESRPVQLIYLKANII